MIIAHVDRPLSALPDDQRDLWHRWLAAHGLKARDIANDEDIRVTEKTISYVEHRPGRRKRVKRTYDEPVTTPPSGYEIERTGR